MRPIPTMLLVMWAVMGSGAVAQTVHTFSMEEAVAYAVQHNYQLQQSKLDVEISRRKVLETTAIGLPQINGTASYNNYIDIPTQVAPASAFNPLAPDDVYVPLRFGLPQSLSAGFTASQLIFDGSYIVGLYASKAYLEASRLGLEKSEIEVRNSVKQTYISAMASRRNMEALRENRDNMERIYTEAKALFEAGFLERQDEEQMRLLRSNVNVQLDFAQRQDKNIQNLLKFQLGIPMTDSLVLTDDIDAMVSAEADGGVSLLEQPFTPDRHIDIRSLEQSMRLTELSLSNERARYYPQLSAFFSHSQNAFRDDADFFSGNYYPTTLWGLQLNVPIFSSLQGHQRVEQAKMELSKVQYQKTLVEQSLTMQVLSAKNDYKSALERYKHVQEDLELAKSIKERTRLKYNQGLASSNDLTQAETQYLTSLGNYINTTIDLLNAKLALDKALGN